MRSIQFLSILLLSIISVFQSESIGNEVIKIKSLDYFNVDCDSHFFYLSMNISVSEKVDKIIPFELTLISPQDLKFKCIIDIYREKFFCFTFVPLGITYRKEELFFHLFYYPPKLPGIQFDSNSFIKYSRRWKDTIKCGNDNYNLNISNVDTNYWNEMTIKQLSGGDCQSFYEDKEQKNIFYFNMTIGIENKNIINALKENKTQIEFLQNIKVPAFLKYKNYENTPPINFKDYAYCKALELVNEDNYDNIDLICNINIPKKNILFSVIKITSFFDKVYIKQIKEEDDFDLNELNLFFNVDNTNTSGADNAFSNETEKYLILDDSKDNVILCPNKPIFVIDKKDTGIYYDSYSKDTNRFSFYLNGTLFNGYKYIDDKLNKLVETSEEISFPLILTDNTLINTDETDSEVKCILSSSTLYNKGNTLIKCIGEKNSNTQEIDLTLNYVQKKNNNCSNIIINWPDTQYYGNKKNIYSYKITVLSLQKKDFMCDENYFTFYINIYDLFKEPKISFNLPLFSPEGIIADCELFDQRTLMCLIDLRYRKLLKNTEIALPKKGTELKLINSEGNENMFIINNYSELGDNEYYNITLTEDCGENVVLSTLEDLGISKKKSIIIGICLGVFLLFLVIFCFFYIIHCFRDRCKRGKRLTMNEESNIK